MTLVGYIEKLYRKFHMAAFSADQTMSNEKNDVHAHLRNIVLDLALDRQVTQRKNYDFSFILFSREVHTVDFVFDRDMYKIFSGVMHPFLKDKEVNCVNDQIWGSGEYYLTWGNSLRLQEFDRHFSMLEDMLKSDKLLITAEDGFVRSVTNFSDQKYSDKYKYSFSVTFEDLAPYYTCYKESRLERMLATMTVTKSQKREAKKLFDFMLSRYLSKYNHQPLLNLSEKCKNAIMVIDQVYTDYSLIKGGGGKIGLKKMLRSAIEDNPGKKILVKIHPDNISKNSSHENFYSDLLSHERVQVIDYECNPIALLKEVDEVYVFSSQLGFEALLLGKKVHVFGVPFYAGWGLTDDVHPMMKTSEMKKRRDRQLSIEEIFYIAYCIFTYYVDEHGIQTSLRYVLLKLEEDRKTFFEDYAIRDELNII